MSVYVCADLHGDAKRLERLLKCPYDDTVTSFNHFDNAILPDEKPSGGDTIIVAGDAGLIYGDYHGYALRNLMAKSPYEFIIMRGNHDARYWRDRRSNDRFDVDGDFLFDTKYPNIKYTIDFGGTVTIDGKDFLFIPGGYSVDKFFRLQNGWQWEPEEELTTDEMRDIELDMDERRRKNEVDYVISHVAPMCAEPAIRHLFLPMIDQSTVSKSMEKWMDVLVNKINYKHWFFGHYHHDIDIMDKRMSMVFNRFLKVC